jgi:hypothetical protein
MADLTCRWADICPVRQFFNYPSTQLFNSRNQILDGIATERGNHFWPTINQSIKSNETL